MANSVKILAPCAKFTVIIRLGGERGGTLYFTYIQDFLDVLFEARGQNDNIISTIVYIHSYFILYVFHMYSVASRKDTN